MEVREGMGLLYLQRRFVFALVWYSVSKRFEVTRVCIESTLHV